MGSEMCIRDRPYTASYAAPKYTPSTRNTTNPTDAKVVPVSIKPSGFTANTTTGPSLTPLSNVPILSVNSTVPKESTTKKDIHKSTTTPVVSSQIPTTSTTQSNVVRTRLGGSAPHPTTTTSGRTLVGSTNSYPRTSVSGRIRV